MPGDAAIHVVPVTAENAGDLADICAPAQQDDLWKRAIEAKRRWVQERLTVLGTFAWLAYDGPEAAGMVQCHPERGAAQVLFIDCMWVPRKEHWGKGIGSRLLAAVEAAAVSGNGWFDGRPADGIAAAAFHGESEGQRSAEDFYRQHGFLPVTGAADLVFKHLAPGAAWSPPPGGGALPSALPTDAGQVVVLLGPLPCPFSYRILSATGAYVAQRLGKPLRIIDDTQEPEAARAHGDHAGILADGQPLRHTLVERVELDREIDQLT